MKIPGLIKSFPIITAIFISTVSLGLFYTFTAGQEHPVMQPGPQASARYDTLQGKKKNSQDSIFNALIVSADKAFNEKNFDKSQSDLEKALQIKPGMQSVKEKLARVKTLVSDKKQQDESAQKANASGDTYFKAKDYLNAKSSYQMAASLNPNDPMAKEKLQKTMELLRSQKAQNILFDVAIASADKLFQAGDYTRAQQEYENASRMLPGDPYPKNRINEIIKLKIDKQVKDEEYAKALASADKFYLSKSYQLALVDYKKASLVKPDEEYPQKRITELNGILAAIKAKDEAYLKVIAQADQSFNDVKYTDAIKSYNEALIIKPEQAYPRERIKEITAIMTRNSNAQADYNKYVALADSMYIDKKYMQARQNYVMASSVKPTESYPKEMISKADKMLTGQEAMMARALEEQYAKTIADADKLMTALSYEPARASYAKAANLKPGERYPQDKIQEIDNILANALKNKEEEYQLILATADKAFANKVYETSRSEFQKALAIKPNEAYPKGKIAELDKLIAIDTKLKAADAKYANTIGKGDSLLLIRMYLPAKNEFQEALKMKPGEVYPKNRIAEIDLALADLDKQKSLENQYDASIAKGDKLLADKSYAPAKAEFTNALKIKPTETYPRDKITEIDKILAELAKVKAFDDHYREVVAVADKLLAAKTYDQARVEYQNALSLKPGEQYPKDKISEIDKVLADLAAKNTLEENYKAAIAKADKNLTDKNLDAAKTEYLAASGLKPAEQYPKSKIAEIEAALASLAKQKAMEEEYAATIARADKLLAATTYDLALAEYQSALRLKPAEEYPKGKIGEINVIMAALLKQKSLDAQYDGLITKADKQLADKSFVQARADFASASALKPLEKYPKEKMAAIDKTLEELAAAAKSLDENYKSAIARADKLLSDKNYEAAKNEYTKASGLKPAEKYPITKIAETDAALAVIAKQKALDDEYAADIAKADKLLTDKAYTGAKAQYQAALVLKSAEQYPKDKIAEADKALADLAAMKDRDDRYNASVTSADKLFGEKSFAAARTEFVNASSIKPQESYPKDKIAAIDVILAGIAAAKALDEKYAGIIAGADKLLAAKTYDQAKTEYLSAGKLKPAETYPTEKIAEIDKILADLAACKTLEENYKASIASADKQLAAKSYEPAKEEYAHASSLKPEETYPKTKIAEIDAVLAGIAKQKALDEEYKATIASADKLLADKSYELAKTEYQKAGGLKPGEQYPKTKLAETEKALTDVARLKALDEQYTAAIAGADKLMGDKVYEKAKTAYADAGKIKPSEQYPKDKIVEISAILAEILKQKTLDENYHASLVKADQLLVSKTYEQAKTEYLNAGKHKPEEQYPKDKIAEIDGIIAELKAKEDAYKAVIAGADQLLLQKKYEEARKEYQNALEAKPQAVYPKEKIAEINKALEELMGKQKYYENLIANGDNSYRDKDLTKARDAYQQALGVFPDQKYPRERVTIITARIDSLYRANKSLYDKAVAEGDRYFNTYEFDKAVDAYTDAANLLPMENYPREMISKIRRTIAENAIADVLKSTVTIEAGTEKQFPFPPVNIASRKNNFIYIKIKNLSGKSFNVLMRYGKDKAANGGVVMKNLAVGGKVNERLVSVKDQDLWSREDNNWISLYPQGGDVEVSFIQVSRAK